MRAEAAAAIGRLGDEDAAMLLFELLGDESELIQESAMGALARMPAERVVPLLLQALTSPEAQVRVRAAETLGLLRDPETAIALIALSKDPRETVRRAAIKALGEIETADVPDLLRAALLDESSLVRQQAVLSLGKLQEEQAATDLLPLLDDPDPKMRFVTLRALGQIRNREVVPRITTFLADARKELRFAAVEALGSIRAVEAVRPLVDVLRDSDRNLRRAAAEALGAIADPQTVPPLLLALEDEHWSVRCAAATALGRIRSFKAVAAPPHPARRRRRHRAARGGGGPGRDRGRARGAPPDPAPVRSRPAAGGTGGAAADGAVRAVRARARLRGGGAGRAAPDRGPRGQARGPPGTPPPARRPGRRQRAGARGGGAGPRRRRLPRRGPSADGPQGLGPLRRGPSGGGDGPHQADPSVASGVFQPTEHNVELSEEEFRLLRDLIHERFGLFFDDNQRASLRTRLAGRLATLDLMSFEDYYHYLRFGPQRGDELQRMVTHLTNNETYFYREMPQLQVFSETVLREIKDAKAAGTDRTLRVLSAGCSTGEEAYTLAMMIYDSGQFFWNWDVQVIGMDVDQVALEKARRAVYHHNSFRSLSPAVKERHFVAATGAAAQVKEPIRRLVSFRAGNIVDAASYMGLPGHGRDLLPERPHLLLGRDDPEGGPPVPRRARARGVPLPRPRRIALAHHRPVHAHPLPGRDDLPQGGAAREPRAGRHVMIRVLIVDDSAFVRQALTRMLGGSGDIEVVGTAVDGKDGWEKALDLRPDVVTLDVKMPRMDGLEALRRIMADCPTAVLLLSSQTKEGAEVTLRGLELGAMDFVDKSRVQGHMNLLSLAEELQAKVRALASVPRARLHLQAAVRETGPKALPAQHAARAQIVVIGTSTGGPPALQAIIPRLPEALPCPVLVVQHMPVGFTKSLAERLDARSVVPVREAVDGELVVRGSVLIAPAGRHMKIRRRGQETRVWLDDEPRSALHRPSVDVLMTSVAKALRRARHGRRPHRDGLGRRGGAARDPRGGGHDPRRERGNLRDLRHAEGGRGGGGRGPGGAAHTRRRRDPGGGVDSRGDAGARPGNAIVSLNGNLEDLPLLDILQIVSFSKKTGYLSIRTEGGEGAIVFQDGYVVAAFSAETPPFDPRYRQLPAEARTPLLRESIERGLEQLIRLREGQFSFSLTEGPPAQGGPARHLRGDAAPGHQRPGAAAGPGPRDGRGPARFDGGAGGLVRRAARRHDRPSGAGGGGRGRAGRCRRRADRAPAAAVRALARPAAAPAPAPARAPRAPAARRRADGGNEARSSSWTTRTRCGASWPSASLAAATTSSRRRTRTRP